MRGCSDKVGTASFVIAMKEYFCRVDLLFEKAPERSFVMKSRITSATSIKLIRFKSKHTLKE